MQTVVTGSTGLIGNAITRALVARGDAVRAVVRDVERARPLIGDDVELVAGDITDPGSVAAAVSGAEVVFHAAGLPEQWARDASIFDRVNRDGTVNVLEAARAAGVRRVIYTSTMDVFRPAADGHLRETEVDPDLKHSAYERSKQLAEREVDRIRADGLDVVLLNPCSVYGPSPVASGMTEFFQRMLDGKVPMAPPGGVSLAFVDAVADAHIAAVDKGVDGERYLLADEHVSMVELAAITAEVAGVKPVKRVAPIPLLRMTAAFTEPLGRAFGIKPPITKDALTFLLWDPRVDASKARDVLGYQPVPIRDGVRRTIESLRA